MTKRHRIEESSSGAWAGPSSLRRSSARSAERDGEGADGRRRPKQLIVMFTHYGCITTKWFPTKSHGALDGRRPHVDEPRAAGAVREQAPHAARHPRDERVDANNKDGCGRGQATTRTCTWPGRTSPCQPVTPNSNDPFSFDTATKFNAKPVGSSLDHVMAQQLSPQRHAAASCASAGQNDARSRPSRT